MLLLLLSPGERLRIRRCGDGIVSVGFGRDVLPSLLVFYFVFVRFGIKYQRKEGKGGEERWLKDLQAMAVEVVS